MRDYEPVLALDGGPDGLRGHRARCSTSLAPRQGRAKLRPGGRIYLEIGADQGAAVNRPLALRHLARRRRPMSARTTPAWIGSRRWILSSVGICSMYAYRLLAFDLDGTTGR